LADATLAMFERYVGSLFTKARNRSERRFQATKRDVAKTLALFGRTIAALKKARAAGKNGLSVIEQEIDMKRLDDAVPVIEAVTAVARDAQSWSRDNPADNDPFDVTRG